VQASIVSLLVVMIFMVVYYRSPGMNAVVALILNLVILLAALAYFGAVLTLPGIAGVILTIGMGVDSNVLIFERIREELRASKGPGFRRGHRIQARLPDNYRYARHHDRFRGLPVRFRDRSGARVCRQLGVGLLANLFTSVYVSRVIFDWHLAKMPREAELSI
jgi:preprotein translocase subunit SecD